MLLLQASKCVELEHEVKDVSVDPISEGAIEEGERYERGLYFGGGSRFRHNSAQNQLERLKQNLHRNSETSKSRSQSSQGRRGDDEDSSNPTKGKNDGGRDSSRRKGPRNQFRNKQKGVSTGPEQPVAVEKGPCHDIKCEGLFQMPVPPSCECRCPGPANNTSCSPQKAFDDNICECVCRDINFNCPGKADFDFDVCNCVCRLHQRDCGSQQKVDVNRCTCVDIRSPPPPPPPRPVCSFKCRGANQYLDQEKCQCKCQRFLIEKTSRYFSHRRHGRSLPAETDLEGALEDELQQKRSMSRSRSSSFSSFSRFHSKTKSRSRDRNVSRVAVRPNPSPLYAQSCPAGKRVDHKSCVCYW